MSTTLFSWEGFHILSHIFGYVYLDEVFRFPSKTRLSKRNGQAQSETDYVLKLPSFRTFEEGSMCTTVFFMFDTHNCLVVSSGL